ncbi:hypothetical protein Fbal_2445 [Ferrimonas balearica DSM 9799]|uniref:Uncharacterized protein n=1 Tax=Ferrimonas balearica (strain DSM 9799 / CCM 4581 / KCTC 23876 / PAT) TaxID=550540 RepID=E1SMX8_FERBD|nr:hypothetical protein Fbal_2445 [Ferrimonas balearica DSM 9799]
MAFQVKALAPLSSKRHRSVTRTSRSTLKMSALPGFEPEQLATESLACIDNPFGPITLGLFLYLSDTRSDHSAPLNTC